MRFLRQPWPIIRDAALDWLSDDVPQRAAALAYYTAFSLAPLLVIAIGLAGLVFEKEAAQGRIVGQLSALVGPKGGEAIQAMIASARHPEAGASAFGAAGSLVVLLVWVYYSAQILLFGAEIAHVAARRAPAAEGRA